MAQNGGNGWATTFSIESNGIIINLSGLKNVIVSSQKTRATLQGGALISDVVSAAAANGTLIPTGVCNCVGYLGAALGGGSGYLQGLFGLGVDNLVSLRIVTGEGKAMTVSPQERPELWWAMRGAGPNFGIVTSAVIRAYPVSLDGLQAWIGPLIFSPDKLEQVIHAINDLTLKPEMAISMLLTSPGGNVTLLVNVFYYGSAEAGKAAFAPLYDVGPVADRTAIVPYTAWNDPSEIPCKKGGRRPNFGVSLARLDPPTWRAVFNEYSNFIKLPGAGHSTILLNAFPAPAANPELDRDSCYPFRDIRFFAGVSAHYADPGIDDDAVKYGSTVRELWQKTDGLDRPQTYASLVFRLFLFELTRSIHLANLISRYINNAFGDEDLSTVYGDSLDRLKSIKAKFDPHGRFNQWFPLS